MRTSLFCLFVLISHVNAWSDSNRVTNGLQVLYTFDEGRGDVVHDVSGTGEPLDLAIIDANMVQWSQGFVTLRNETLMKSDRPAKKLRQSIVQSKELTIEAWVKPANDTQSGPARIVSFSSDTSHRNITLGQNANAWEARLRTTATSENGTPATVTARGTCSNELAHIVYARDLSGTATMYLNSLAIVSQSVGGDLSNWDDFHLLLANEATGDRAWLGELHLVAIYSRALLPGEVKQNYEAGSDQEPPWAESVPSPVARTVDFVNDVQPILRAHCFECHSAGNEEGSLNLAIKSLAMEGGEHGPVLVRGNSLASSIVHLVSGVEPDRMMPPEDNEPLNAEQIGILRAWIDQGAAWPAGVDVLDPRLEKAREHWSFQRLKKTAMPVSKGGDVWSRTSIDAFIAEKLVENKISVSKPLPPNALARRIYFDVIGLPPTPEQVDTFVSSYGEDPIQAVSSLVDQLLSSQHYGERWARHWLDLVRFAESDGQESDRDRPTAFRYRDFVIHALNDDMPFDQFVRWQIAGDEYEPNSPVAVAATGFLTAGTNSVLDEKFIEEERLFNRYNELDDVISTLGTSMLGITVGCARCHDHKYDAFSAREYYRLLSVFHSGDRKSGKLPNGEDGLFFRDFDSSVRTTWLFRRSDFFDRELEVKMGFPSMLSAGRDADQYWTEAKSESQKVNSTFQRRALAEWITDVEFGGGPLLARVIVNRIWQHHFGQGLVRTENDFGVRGELPTHPDLLEYLANDFVANGWQFKRLHRMILNSAVYQQGSKRWSERWQPYSQQDADAMKVDPDNRLLWKMTPMRLEVEALRDAMLSVSGALNLQAFGPSFKPYIPPEANLARNIKGENYPSDAPDNADTRRRSVYMFHKRLVPYPLFQAFDRPDLLVGCSRRQNTTVAPQAMAMLNDRFVRDCAIDFARHLLADGGDNDMKLVEDSFRLAFSRRPSDLETEASISFIQAQREAREERDRLEAPIEAVADYCQTLFGLNEFIYVD